MNEPAIVRIAFGDDLSEMGMLEQSAIGVAMANAIPAVQTLADRITALPTTRTASRWCWKSY